MDLREIILNFSDQISEGVRAAGNFKVAKQYDRIVVCGMGGSIIPGMILLTWHEHQNKGPGVPIVINNNYDLPSDVTSKDIVICISWSGTTEETASSLQSALDRKIDAILITNPVHPSEKVGELARANSVKIIEIPIDSLQPRWAVGYMTGALFTILGLEAECPTSDVGHSDELEKDGKELAAKIGTKIPLLYSSYSWRKLGAFWKANFNETSKIPAYWNYTPTMTHDELEIYTKHNLPFYPIIFRDEKENPRNIRDLNTAIAILDKQEYNYAIVNLSSSPAMPTGKQAGKAHNVLETIFNNYILGLWTSYYLAQNLAVDPENIALIQEYKKLKLG